MKQLIEWEPVSDHIKKFIYNKDLSHLDVFLKNGITYRYYGVPDTVRFDLMHSKGPAKFYLQNVYGKYVQNELKTVS